MVLDSTRLVPQQPINRQEIRNLVYPRLFGDFANDFQDVLIYDNGMFSNSAYNSNNQKHKKYYLIFNDIDFDHIKAISYLYACHGDDARIDLYLDSIDGPPLASTQMIAPDTSKRWDWITTDLTEARGKHDLILHFVNTTGDFRTGVVTLREIRLVDPESPITKKQELYQDSLLQLYRMSIKTPIMKERSEILKRHSYVFERGNYLVKGDSVGPGSPSNTESR